jgi:REP element-mobilizing transposase RayT
MTTNEYIRGVKNLNWEPFDKKLWQRNYWEHIVRDENSYFKITNYIINNPMNWKEDILNLENLNCNKTF